MTDQQHCRQAVTPSACLQEGAALVLPPYLLALIATADRAARQLLETPTTAPDWLRVCHHRQALAEELAHAITAHAATQQPASPVRPIPQDCAALLLSARLVVLIGTAGAAFRRLLDMRATDPQWLQAFQHWQVLAGELAQVVITATTAGIERQQQAQAEPPQGAA